MQVRHLRVFLAMTLGEGLLALLFFLARPSDIENARLFGFSYWRLGLALAFLLFLVFLFAWTVRTWRDARRFEKFANAVDRFLRKKGRDEKRLFLIQRVLIILQVALAEAWLLTFFVLPLPTRPFILWGLLVAFQGWLILRIVYRRLYRERSTLLDDLRAGWRSWSPAQRRVFYFMAGIGAVYFLAFIPANLGGVHADEHVIYPDVVRMLLPGETFKETLQRLLINENWWYGYPYLPLSAAALVIPRLIYGQAFAAQQALNLLLLRQFISVLPMILALGLLVYLVTRFGSLWQSAGLFIFLLLAPGVVMYNYRFWHPDSLVLLTVVLTIFFLQRDRLRFGRFFYLAAVTCGLAIAIKFWGEFFFLTIGVYLLTGWRKKQLTFPRMMLTGLLFVFIMTLTFVLSSPTIFVPWSYDMLVSGLQYERGIQQHGYDEPDPGGAYQTGLAPWLKYIDIYYMKPYFFFFAFGTLILGSFIGSQKDLNRLLLTWCIVLAVYFVAFVAVKRSHYMMQLTVPLYASAFLFPALTDPGTAPRPLSFLNKPVAGKIAWGITLAVFGSQFVFNLLSILTSPWIGVFVKP